jgi:hypothetical protein
MGSFGKTVNSVKPSIVVVVAVIAEECAITCGCLQ